MKNRLIIIGLIILSLVLIPSSVYAYEVHMRDTVNIYTVAPREDGKATVSTFDDNGNKCYVTSYFNGSTGSYASDISCVRMK